MNTTRRDFLAVTAGTIVAACCTGCASHLKGLIPPTVGTNGPSFPIERFPALADIGGVAAAGPVTLGDYTGNVWVRRTTDAAAEIISAECTHFGCDVEWRQPENLFVCPCHGSRYEADGTVVKGPAKRALRRWPAKVTGNAIIAA